MWEGTELRPAPIPFISACALDSHATCLHQVGQGEIISRQILGQGPHHSQVQCAKLTEQTWSISLSILGPQTPYPLVSFQL